MSYLGIRQAGKCEEELRFLDGLDWRMKEDIFE